MANNNKLETTISELVGDLKNPSATKDWTTLYWFSWISCFSLFALLTYLASAAVPNDIHLPQNLGSVSFWFENTLWFALALLSARVGFLSAYPTEQLNRTLKTTYAMLALLAVVLLLKETPSALANEFSEEMHFERGPCGSFILINGLVLTLGMFAILKRAAPTRLKFTGLWVAVSVGALGSMFMHLVCTHESGAHEIIWHVLPLLMLVGIVSSSSQRLLRW
jgi:hypothetical protein